MAHTMRNAHHCFLPVAMPVAPNIAAHHCFLPVAIPAAPIIKVQKVAAVKQSFRLVGCSSIGQIAA